MKLKNKKTGKIIKLDIHCIAGKVYESLAEINEEWEDYEEPTTYYYISDFGAIREGDVGKFVEDEIARKEIGNHFSSEEEAELAVRKLKAWKRLKDKGFHWLWYNSTPSGNSAEFYINDWDKEATRDITLLFGGKE